MITVYEKICAFTKATKFTFAPDHKKWIGSAIVKEWRAQGRTSDELELVQSEEENGTWMVLSYPNEFEQTMEQVIVRYVQNLTRPKPQKFVEKPPNPIPPKPTSGHKKRARKPVQKPAFSGKDLKK